MKDSRAFGKSAPWATAMGYPLLVCLCVVMHAAITILANGQPHHVPLGKFIFAAPPFLWGDLHAVS